MPNTLHRNLLSTNAIENSFRNTRRTDFCLDLLEEIGAGITSQEGTWPGGGGHNPGDLGQDIEALGGIRNTPNPNP